MGRGRKAKAKTPIDKLEITLHNILQEYSGDVLDDIGELAKEFAKKGAQAVRQYARLEGWGENTGYDTGWTTRYEEGRYSKQGIVFNKDVPGLPHLLEHGHALRGGGRSHTDAIPHIAPVEEKISEEFYKAVKESL